MARLISVGPIDADETEEGAGHELARVLIEILSELRPVQKS
jgi:hypothetical protein